MNILHLASFDGNIGDNASHMGFQKVLKGILSQPFKVDQLEIRKFYNNYSLADKHSFDNDFADLVNSYDLLFIGGGGFLDFDIPGTVTGATINLSKDVLDRINVPVMISSIGCNPRNQLPEGNVEKFRAFLDDFLPRDNTFLAVRNDGSKKVLESKVGNTYSQIIPEVLDHGFFYENDGNLYRPSPKNYILINTTSDQVMMTNKASGKLDPDFYISQMREVISYIINETEYNVVFAPHIYSDIKAIDQLVSKLNDYHIRTRITITPYSQGNYGCDQIYSAYKNSSMVIGMRFHSNVCSIAMNVPSVGIAVLDRVESVYDSLGLGHCVIRTENDFKTSLIEKIQILPGSKPLTGITEGLFKKKSDDTINSYKIALKNWGLI